MELIDKTVTEVGGKHYFIIIDFIATFFETTVKEADKKEIKFLSPSSDYDYWLRFWPFLSMCIGR